MQLQRKLAMLACLIPVAMAAAQTPPGTLAQLRALEPLPKLTVMWPSPDAFYSDPAYPQIVRVCGSATVRLMAELETVQAAMAAKPSVLAIVVQPFNKWDGFTLEGAATVGEAERAHLVRLREAAEAVCAEIGDQEVFLYLDHELWNPGKLDPVDLAVATAKLQLAVAALRTVWPDAPLVWYNWGQRLPDRFSEPVDHTALDSMWAHHTEYYGPVSYRNRERREATVPYWAERGKHTMVAVSLGSEWSLTRPPSVKGREFCFTCEPALWKTRQHAWEIYNNPNIAAVKVWPEPGRAQVPDGRFLRHFIAHSLGANGVEVPNE